MENVDFLGKIFFLIRSLILNLNVIFFEQNRNKKCGAVFSMIKVEG